MSNPLDNLKDAYKTNHFMFEPDRESNENPEDVFLRGLVKLTEETRFAIVDGHDECLVVPLKDGDIVEYKIYQEGGELSLLTDINGRSY